MTETKSSIPARSTIPEKLLEYDQWLCWRTDARDGKLTKIPVDPSSGGFASTTDSDTWMTFQDARMYAQEGDANGLGFVFTNDDPLVGVDLDDCRDRETGYIDDWAASIIERLGSYTETSPSGTGFHVLISGDLPGERNRTGDLEMYETTRFFTVTGNHLQGTQPTIQERRTVLEAVYDEHLAVADTTDESARASDGQQTNHGLDDDELLKRARDAANSEKFVRLWRGDTSGYESHSEADMALCSLLAFWTGGDPKQMDRLFRESGLMREKWDETHFADGSTYGEKTIDRAIAGTSDFYDPATQSADGKKTDQESSESEGHSRRTNDPRNQIDELQERLQAVLEENKRLQQELAEERVRREELEAELAEVQSNGGWLFSWR